jgi:hypothetical protein
MANGSRLWVLGLMMAGVMAAHAATAEPPDPCSLLHPEDIKKVLGGKYFAYETSPAPQPYANTVKGTDCRYPSGSDEVLFRVYFDPSPAEATKLFAQLKMFYSPPKPVPGLGDEAYFDPSHGLHVRKGNVRFFIEGSNDEGKLTALGQVVAGKL